MKDNEINPLRKIIHIDMDAFFASVEQRDNPLLRNKPVAVGGSARRGVVAAASYEARQYGVRSAMPSITAARRCPSLVFVPPRFEVYRSVSQQIRDIFNQYSDAVEPLSLDEAYLDVTQDKRTVGSAIRTAELIRASIHQQTGLTASAGVSYNKFLAKVASDQNKPDGIFVVRPQEGAQFAAGLPVRRFYGVGPKTAERMNQLDIHVGADLRAQSLGFLHEHFGSSAEYLYNAVRGVDHRQVRPDRIRKSVGRERTFQHDLQSENDLRDALNHVIESVWERITKNGAVGRTVTLKVKYADFRQITRSRSFERCVSGRQEFSSVAHELLTQLLPVPLGVRLIGLTMSSLVDQSSPVAPSGHVRQHTFDF
ncbi:MAG: DNA polymerase IV [Proteobacteria bacterium]|nr:DNA polymerase IV [Pseudomonadota bacterium]MCP4467747.1 DNA polymerase IV [Halieaceae bacterium]MCP4842892.1 DNA polymerase IV [Halieaceae bacterium]